METHAKGRVGLLSPAARAPGPAGGRGGGGPGGGLRPPIRSGCVCLYGLCLRACVCVCTCVCMLVLVYACVSCKCMCVPVLSQARKAAGTWRRTARCAPRAPQISLTGCAVCGRVLPCSAIAMPSFTGHDTAFRMCFHRLPSLRPCRSVVFLPFYLFSLTKTPPLGCVSAAFPRLRHRLSLVLSLPSPR